MKTTWKMGVAVGAVAAAAVLASAAGCGGGQDPRADVVEIRMVGEHQGNLSAVLLPVASITATASGRPLEVETLADTVDLAANRRDGLLARVRIPAGAGEVAFSVKFDDAGGYESSRGNGAVDARGAEIGWRAPAAELRKEGRAVITVDLRRSFRSLGDGMRLLPSSTVMW